MYVSYHKVEYSGVLIHDFQFTQGILKNPIIPIYQVGILTNFFLCVCMGRRLSVVCKSKEMSGRPLPARCDELTTEYL